MEVLGSGSHSGGELEGDQDPLSEGEAALEARDAGRNEHGEENQQVHRGPQDQRTPGVNPIKTVSQNETNKQKTSKTIPSPFKVSNGNNEPGM